MRATHEGAATRERFVESPSNPRVKSLVALRSRRERESSGTFVVEGRDELIMAMESGARVIQLYYCAQLVDMDRRGDVLDRVRSPQVEVVQLSKEAFGKASYRQGPDGWLAVVGGVGTSLDSLALRPDPLILVGERVEKPGNLGALLRTADATGVDAVVAADPVTDWGNPNVVRASKGALFSVPVVAAASRDVIRWLDNRRIGIVAATPEGGVPFTDCDFDRPTAIVVGSESSGLGGQWLAAAQVRARLPMFGRVDSLNVSVSAAVLLYEALRQRRRLG
ncbi:MAG: RNA methyltransferase [Actinomycetota bacterium]|nr:RNA methyltransferase [Actinomycetota bacterium]